MAFLPSTRRENPLTSFRNMLDEFFGEPFFMSDREISGKMWPRVDITEEKERFLVRADLPGISKDDINVSIEGDTLTISGEKKEEHKREEGTYSHLERSYGSFQRSFSLPEYVDKENVDAKYKNGVLELSLVKTGEPKKK
ncbi:MAG: Hsp20 family protein, partial [Chitinivibrionales bacterium]|nr:Hsp20 family protein [Chitinivibrionales bacterium]